MVTPTTSGSPASGPDQGQNPPRRGYAAIAPTEEVDRPPSSVDTTTASGSPGSGSQVSGSGQGRYSARKGHVDTVHRRKVHRPPPVSKFNTRLPPRVHPYRQAHAVSCTPG